MRNWISDDVSQCDAQDEFKGSSENSSIDRFSNYVMAFVCSNGQR